MSGPLQHSAAHILSNLLISMGHGSLPTVLSVGSWPIYVSGEPDQPDNCITIYDTEPRDQGRTMDGERQCMEGFQVRVRAISHIVGYPKIHAIAIAMDTIVNKVLTLDSSQYIVKAITRTSGPLSIGKETPQSKRNLFTVNAVVSLRLHP